MAKIVGLHGREILDSRGRPTVLARCELASGAQGSASVPSGASTGAAEALELRDGDPRRYRGLGCRNAVGNVEGELRQALAGRSFTRQEELDRTLIELDGTPSKRRLGANALLAVSLAFARAVAVERGVPLYEYLASLVDQPLSRMPRPTINLFSGGKHAGGQVPIQDVLVVPSAARTIDEALAMTFDVYQAAVELTAQQYGARPLTADEGGLAPPFANTEAMLEAAVAAIEKAGFSPGKEVDLAIDVASTHFFHDGYYHLGDEQLTSLEMIRRLQDWSARYPIVSIEDGLAEEDWSHWGELFSRLGGQVLIVGDDLLCTNPGRVSQAVSLHAANTLLLKVNQVGTLTEATESYRIARRAGWSVTISARSGETEDDWLADLSVGWKGDQIKVGSITQSERLAKYNRLLAIEAELHLPLVAWPATP
jgi:enolase